MNNENDAKFFDDLVAKKLGHYVYVLLDPETGHPFYVGKGGGRKGAGNSRIFDHFDEARSKRDSITNKIKQIWRIWDEQKDVPWRIVRWGLDSEDEAFLVESALIDLLREMKISLTNDQAGHGSSERGMKSPSDLRAWMAPDFDPSSLPPDLFKRPIFIFNISEGAAERRDVVSKDSPELYQKATCQYWKVTEKNRSREGAMAIGCINGIARAVFDIEDWKKKGDRWEIIPSFCDSGKEQRDALLYKNFTVITKHCHGYWGFGNYLIFSIEDDNRLTILRGSSDPTIQF